MGWYRVLGNVYGRSQDVDSGWVREHCIETASYTSSRLSPPIPVTSLRMSSDHLSDRLLEMLPGDGSWCRVVRVAELRFCGFLPSC